MSSSYTVVILLVVMPLLGAVGATSMSLQQHAFAKTNNEPDPCKDFKLLVKYVEKAGLLAVATGNENEMSNLIDDFQDFSEKILEFSPPDKGKC
jgi:hypothetical protein